MHRRIALCIFAIAALLCGLAGAAVPVIRVTRDPLCGDAKISPMQYGQFVEYLCDLVPAMWAEKLYDNSFEGLSPYAFEYIKETDFKEKPWYPSGATNRAIVSLDKTTKVNGDVSKKIEAAGPTPATVGISEDGVCLEAGAAYEFHCFLRAKDVTGPVRVTIHRDAQTFASCELEPTRDWKRFDATLKSAKPVDNATLTIQFRGPGTLWIDNASLMPIDTIGGWRRDVVAALRDLHPGVVRFGGSAVDPGDFEWRDSVGDPDRRKPFRAWGGLQPTGPGLEEFVQLCRAVDAEPLICVRFHGKTPRDAAGEVEYFNGPLSSPMGALRAKNGHPHAYRVRYWQIGNEIVSPQYDASVGDFARAMKSVDPSIQIFSSFPTPAVIKRAGDWLDFVCPHQYSSDLPGMERGLIDLAKMIRDNQPPGRSIKVAVTEWNTTAGDAGPRRAMLWTLANALACSRYHNLLHRHADVVSIANRSNLANSFCSGIIQTDHRGRMYLTPTYYAQQLYATRSGTRPLKVESDPPLDVSATLSRAGNALTLLVVNDTGAPVARTIDLSAFDNLSAREISVSTLADRDRTDEPDVTNTFGDPHRVATVESTIDVSSPKFDYQFAALSLTALTCPLIAPPPADRSASRPARDD